MADVYLYQTPDDGEINIENGTVELQESPSSAAYISMFGGNVSSMAFCCKRAFGWLWRFLNGLYATGT